MCEVVTNHLPHQAEVGQAGNEDTVEGVVRPVVNKINSKTYRMCPNGYTEVTPVVCNKFFKKIIVLREQWNSPENCDTNPF